MKEMPPQFEQPDESGLRNIEYLYLRSYQECQALFRDGFETSEAYKNMVLLLHENMIEYKFMRQAGMF